MKDPARPSDPSTKRDDRASEPKTRLEFAVLQRPPWARPADEPTSVVGGTPVLESQAKRTAPAPRDHLVQAAIARLKAARSEEQAGAALHAGAKPDLRAGAAHAAAPSQESVLRSDPPTWADRRVAESLPESGWTVNAAKAAPLSSKPFTHARVLGQPAADQAPARTAGPALGELPRSAPTPVQMAIPGGLENRAPARLGRRRVWGIGLTVAALLLGLGAAWELSRSDRLVDPLQSLARFESAAVASRMKTPAASADAQAGFSHLATAPLASSSASAAAAPPAALSNSPAAHRQAAAEMPQLADVAGAQRQEQQERAARRATLAASLATMEKQAMQLLAAGDYAQAHAIYEQLHAAAPRREKYEVMLRLVAKRLQDCAAGTGDAPCD